MPIFKQNKITSCLGIIAIATSLTLVACKSGSGSNDTSTGITEAQVKTNYINVAHAMYSDALAKATDLQTSIDAFLANPSESTHMAAKTAYKQARPAYQQSEVLRWDTDITQGKNLDSDDGIASVDEWEGQVNAWPLDEGLIDYVEGAGAGTYNAISQTSLELTEENIINLNGLNGSEANVATGVHAIEFLLWGQDTNGTNAGAGERSYTDYIDGSECTNGNCDRRRTYLKIITDLLVKDLTNMVAEWSDQSTPNTLANNFDQSDVALDYIVGAMRAMATDELASARMAVALEANDTEEEHDCFSDLSHLAIYNNFQGVKAAFNGSYGNVSGASLGDLVKQRSNTDYQNFVDALDAIEVDMKAILDAGERTSNTVRYDQIVGQADDGVERVIAKRAIENLVGLTDQFETIQDLLSIDELTANDDGD